MDIISGMENLSGRGVSVALGNFDGLHIGHAAVLRSAVVHAGESEPAVLMFRSHPQRLLSGKMPAHAAAATPGDPARAVHGFCAGSHDEP